MGRISHETRQHANGMSHSNVLADKWDIPEWLARRGMGYPLKTMHRVNGISHTNSAAKIGDVPR
jgi:hypothetical protein